MEEKATDNATYPLPTPPYTAWFGATDSVSDDDFGDADLG